MAADQLDVDGVWLDPELLVEQEIGDLQRAGLYALIDHSGASGLLAQLSRRPALRWRSLFEGSTEERALEVAPILVELMPPDRKNTAPGRALVDWSQRTCSLSHSTLWLRSRWTLEAMTVALKKRLDASLPDDLPIVLRYFDTRVFVALLDALTPEQCSAFLSPADRWSWMDRAGDVRHREASHPDIDLLLAPLTFSAAQETALIDAAEADAVLHLMRQVADDLCHSIAPMALHGLVSRCLPVARSMKIMDARHQALFCLTEMEEGPEFFEQPKWTSVLQRPAEDSLDFVIAFKQMRGRT